MHVFREEFEDLCATCSPLKVEEVIVLSGANYYSAGPVILIKLNLGSYDEVFSDQVDGLLETLKKELPGLRQHHCSEGREGGFLKRIKEGTLTGHIAEHIAIELQTQAGMDVSFGKTRQTPVKGVYNIVFRYFDEHAGKYAGLAAVNILNQILNQEEIFPPVSEIIDNLIHMHELCMPDAGTQAIINEIKRREIPFTRLDPFNLIQLGTGKFQKRIRATQTWQTSMVAAENVRDIYLSTLMMRDAGIPIARTIKTQKVDEALAFRKKIRKPVVIKTAKNTKDHAVFPGLKDAQLIRTAFTLCSTFTDEIIVQEQIPGFTYRLLVINHKFVAATQLQNPEIIGNGKDSVAILIEKLNRCQVRKPGEKSPLSILEPDEKIMETLSFCGYSLESVPEKGVKVVLSHNSTTSTGALTTDVTGIVHPLNRFIAEKASKVSGLDVIGINIVCPDISKPFQMSEGAVISMVAAPDFRMHINPWQGKPRNVARPFVDMIFPENTPCRVPMVSVTGSAGKSLCAYLIHFILEKEGFKTGLAHSDGVFIAGRKILNQNMANAKAAQLILQDPDIDCAVLETSVESIISQGLGYGYADVGIVLNVHEQMQYPKYIANLNDLAYAKALVAEEVHSKGVSILNADNSYVAKMSERLYSKAAYFSNNPDNTLLKEHIKKGRTAAVLENGALYLWHDKEKILICPIGEIPLWSNRANTVIIDSMLAAILATFTLGVKPDRIAQWLNLFIPAPYTLHGRLTIARLKKTLLFIDKPTSRQAMSHLKHKIPEQQKHAHFLIDLSGAVPQLFWPHFFEAFNHQNYMAHFFFSEPFTAKRLEVLSLKAHLVNLNEQFAPSHGFDSKMSEEQITEKIKSLSVVKDNYLINMQLWPSLESCLRNIKDKKTQQTAFLFSWNFKSCQEIMEQNFKFSWDY